MRPATPAAFLAALLFAASGHASDIRRDGAAFTFTHALKAGGIAEECLSLPKGTSRDFEWQATGAVDFNIHFHRGDDVTYPVRIDGRDKGRGRFTSGGDEDYCWMWTAKGPATVTGRIGPQQR